MRQYSLVAKIVATAVGLAPMPALAWGEEGHKVIALIAEHYLTTETRSKVQSLLDADDDELTTPDLTGRSFWADKWRGRHPETSAWHYVNLEVGHPDLNEACSRHPPAAVPASAGPAKSCIVDRIEAFEKELSDPAVDRAERMAALKFLLHFVGDLHQPLHAADNLDRGGNCVRVSLGGARTLKLHAYWDTTVVEELGADQYALATKLFAVIKPEERNAWEKGTAADWALDTYKVAVSAAYTIGSQPGCQNDSAPIALPVDYDEKAKTAAAVQLEKAGVRLAAVLNRSFGQ